MAESSFILFNELIKNTTLAFKKWSREEKRYLLSNIKRNSKVLDVGCGDGRTIKELLQITNKITGVDNDIKAVKFARRNFKRFSKTKILLADAKALPIKNAAFDYIVCMGNTFGNFGADKYQILREMRRVLKPRGKIIISVYSEDALDERLKAYKKIGLGVTVIRKSNTILLDIKQTNTNISEQFSKVRLANIFKKVGFKFVGIKKVNIAYLCILSK
jgi:ubiquinone/menaquinone biosynthesis C-methylase UbiE